MKNRAQDHSACRGAVPVTCSLTACMSSISAQGTEAGRILRSCTRPCCLSQGSARHMLLDCVHIINLCTSAISSISASVSYHQSLHKYQSLHQCPIINLCISVCVIPPIFSVHAINLCTSVCVIPPIFSTHTRI